MMGQRNTIIDLEMQQQPQGYLHPEPCIFLGNLSTFPQPNIPMLITEPYEHSMFYTIPQYHGAQHHHPHLDVGVAAAPYFYVPHVAPCGQSSQLPSFSNHGVLAAASDEYESNGHYVNNARGLNKIKNAEGIPGNIQFLNTQAAPSSSFTPSNTTNGASHNLPQFRGRGNPPLQEVGSQRSVRNRSDMDPVLVHGQTNLIPGNYLEQPFPPPSCAWFNQQFNNGRTDGNFSPWSQQPSIRYVHGSNVDNGSLESRNISLQRYHHETSGNRNSAGFVNPSLMNPRHHNFTHHPSPPPNQEGRSHSTSVYPHMATAQPTGSRIYMRQQETPLTEPTLRHHNLPRLRLTPADEVALLEIGDFYEVGIDSDHHRDMRLDIENMSYEELLALSERIGTVNTGLSEETITNHLKTRIYLSCEMNLEEAPPVDQETDSCVICQENYKSQEKIGTLDCGHEYHADCLKNWLFVKNVCPICKSKALARENKHL